MTPAILLLAAAIQASPCLPVSGDTIRAADLVEAVPAFADLPAGLSLGYAPTPGATRVFRAQDIEKIAAQEGVTLEQRDDVCFEWRLRSPSEEEFHAAITAALGSPDVSIEVLETSRYPAPPGEMTFPLSSLRPPPHADPDRPVLWKGYIEHGARRRFAVWARVRLTADITRVVTTEPVQAGSRIRPEQVTVESCQCFPFDDGFARTPEDVVGRISRQPLQAGELISIRSIDRPLDVDRGDSIMIEVRNGSAVIKAEGRAETRGRRGDTILVRNDTSGKKFRATVTGPKQAILALSEK